MRNRILSVCAVILLAPGSAGAQSPKDNPGVASALTLLDIWLEAQVAYRNIPAISVAVVYDQDLLWSKGFGYANIAKQSPATANTIYSICSISKLFTSTAILQLRDEGKLRLDDPIKKHLTWFNIKNAYPDAPPITIQGVLTHSSGLPRESDFPYWTGPDYPFPTREQIIEKLSSQETVYPADEAYQYSNLGMSLLGQVVAAASGQPFPDYVRQRILDPLGMKDTTTEMPENQRNGRLATGYSMIMRDHGRQPMPFFQARGIAPAAGFTSTVEDLARFASWQFRLLAKGGTEVIAANTLKEMHRVHWLDPNFTTARGWGYSVATRNGKIIVGHNGTCPGYHTQIDMSPKDKVAVIVMSNGNDISPQTYSRGIFDIVAPAIARAVEGSKKGEKAEKGEKTDPTLEKFVGRYDAPFGGETHVLIWDGSLTTFSVPTDNPVGTRPKYKRISDNVFRVVREDESLGETVTFELGPDGNVTRMIRSAGNYSIRVK